MFQFSGLALLHLCIQCRVTGLQPDGFPHSEIHGSMLVCSSPWLMAAYHLLHRQSMPRHPPYALNYLTSHHFTWYELMPYLLSMPTEAGIPMTLSRTRYTHNAFLRYGTNITSKNNRLSTITTGCATCRPSRTLWSYSDSNRGPPACKAGALPTEL